MDIATAQEFVRRNHRAVMATMKADGTPQLTPITVGGDDEGYVIVSTRATAMKTRNLRRDQRVWLCVLNDGFFGEWIQIEGSAEIVPLPAAMDLLVDYYRRISGEHPDWDGYRAAMERDKRVILRITITKAGPNKSG